MARAGRSGASGPNQIAMRDRKPSPAAATTPPRRQSQRITSSAIKSSTPKKSIYFEHGSDSGENSDGASSAAYEDDEGQASVTTVDEADEDDYESSDENQSRKRKRGSHAASGSIPKKIAKGQELWREGAKLDLQPGQEVFIALPRARDPGKTPYRDETIHPNTMLFLADLKKNNERSWLKLHDKDFRQSEQDWKSFADQITEKLVEVDETIPELPAKDIIFRIYRDIRFSSDPTPYKPHFSGAWSRTGRKGPYAAYYLQIAPGKSFLGGGLWCPEAQYLALLRRDFDRRSERVKSVLANPAIRKVFLSGANTETKALQAFLNHNRENALKRHPKGYDQDNPNIGLLRLRNFTMGRKLTDLEVTGPKALENLIQMMKTLMPFITYLNNVVMPDPGADAEGDDDDDNDDDGDEEEDDTEDSDDA